MKVFYDKIDIGPYKYRLRLPFCYDVGIVPDFLIIKRYFSLGNGKLVIQPGYCWDGATGGIDTETFVRGSLVHDVLCQMMNEGLLNRSWQTYSDKLFKKICLDDGMWRLRAWWVFTAVRLYDRIFRRSK